MTEYVWDRRNRLRSVIDKNSAAVTQQINYTYDAQGRRVRRSIDIDGGTPTFTHETFVYSSAGASGDELSMRLTGATGAASVLTHRYMHGPDGQALVDEVFNAVGQSTEVLWLLADQQNTIRDVVNSDGVLRKHVDYDSFGKITAEQYFSKTGASITSTHAEAVDQALAYTGQERDAATGLQLHGKRWYDPFTGRWRSTDPSGLGPDSNLYRYVHNSPVIYVDPTGLSQAGNPLNSLFGGYTGGSVAADKPFGQYIASGGGLSSYTSVPLSKVDPQLQQINQYNLADHGQRAYQSVLSGAPGDVFTGPSIRRSTAQIPTQSQILENYFNDANYTSIRRRADEEAAHKLANRLIQKGSVGEAAAGRLALSLEQAGHGLYPGVGEYQDAESLFGKDSSLSQRAIAGLSLGINVVTAGAGPNFGGVSRAATHNLDDIARAQRLTHQIEVIADSRFYSQIDTLSLQAGVQSSGALRIAEAVQTGKIGETAAGISAAKKGYVSPLSGIMRFPDEVLEAVREIKNVKSQGLTSQIKDYIAIAQNLGKKFELTVRENTTISKLLKAAESTKAVIINRVLPPH